MSAEPVETDDDVRVLRTAPEVPVAMDTDTFRRLGHDLVDRIAALLDDLPRRPVTSGLGPEKIREHLDARAPLPSEGGDPGAILDRAARLLTQHSLYNGHPRFFGYITASPTPIGMLGDLLAAAVNPNVGAWKLSPVASEIEAQTVRWISQLIGYPDDGGGLMVSGGNMANIVGFLAARARAGAEHRIRAAGVGGDGAPRMTTYVSAETHTWIEKAADLSGLGTEQVRWIPTDDRLRMDLGALQEAVGRDRAAGHLPMMVVGTAGTVMTGVVDPLPELARFCREEAIWFHVDGAYGGFAAASPDAPPELIEGLPLADSLAVDPHKWLYAPLEVGCVLVRRPDDLRNAFAYHPPYYHFGVEAINYVDLGPQNSRGFRALKVWLALQQAGREGYARLITQDMALARRLHGAVTDHPELEALAQGLGISAFRYVPPEVAPVRHRDDMAEYLDRLNAAIQDRLEREGEVFLSNAVVGGRYALRACIVNFNTTAADVDAVPGIVARVGRELHLSLEGPPP